MIELKIEFFQKELYDDTLAEKPLYLRIKYHGQVEEIDLHKSSKVNENNKIIESDDITSYLKKIRHSMNDVWNEMVEADREEKVTAEMIKTEFLKRNQFLIN